MPGPPPAASNGTAPASRRLNSAQGASSAGRVADDQQAPCTLAEAQQRYTGRKVYLRSDTGHREGRIFAVQRQEDGTINYRVRFEPVPEDPEVLEDECSWEDLAKYLLPPNPATQSGQGEPAQPMQTDAPAAAAAPSGRAATATATADSDPTTAIVSTTARPTRQPAPPSITNARAPSLPLSPAARTHSQNGLSNSPQPTGTRDDPIPVDSDDENGNGNEQVVNRVGLSNGDTPVIEMLDSDSDEEQARGPPGGAVAAKAQGRKRTAGNTGKANGAPSAKAGPSSRLAPAANGHPRNNTHKKAQPADVTHNNTQPRGNTHSTAGASVQKQAQSPSTPGSAQGPSAQGPSVGSPSSAQKRVRDTDEEGFLVPSPKRPVVQSQEPSHTPTTPRRTTPLSRTGTTNTPTTTPQQVDQVDQTQQQSPSGHTNGQANGYVTPPRSQTRSQPAAAAGSSGQQPGAAGQHSPARSGQVRSPAVALQQAAALISPGSPLRQPRQPQPQPQQPRQPQPQPQQPAQMEIELPQPAAAAVQAEAPVAHEESDGAADDEMPEAPAAPAQQQPQQPQPQAKKAQAAQRPRGVQRVLLPGTPPPVRATQSPGRVTKKVTSPKPRAAKAAAAAPEPAPAQEAAPQAAQPAQTAATDGPARTDMSDYMAFRDWGLPGHIKRVHVIDFMCHKNMQIDFGPHITIITGANGSGKSAVLQALQVCLGATARNTLRGSSLAAFVRDVEGVTQAIVRVTLWNEDTDHTPAYKPDTYGREITIERRIRKPSGGSYRILSEHGKCVSTKREDLDALLDHFNINAANPLAIITQDMARTFYSHEKDDKQKQFRHFMDATQLQDAEDCIIAVAEIIASGKEAIETYTKRVEAKDKELVALKRKCDAAQDKQGLEDKRDWLLATASWAEVGRSEERIVNHLKEIQEAEKRRAQTAEQVRKAQTTLDSVRADQARKGDELSRVQAEIAKGKTNAKRLKDAVTAAVTRRQELAAEVAALTSQHEEEMNNHQNCQEQLSQVHQEETEAANNAAIQAIQKQLQTCVEQVQKQQEACAQIDNQLKEAREALQKAKDRQETVRGEQRGLTPQVTETRREVTRLQQELAALDTNTANRAAVFGGRLMMNFLAAVNRQRFRYPVIGPIGAYLSLNDARWWRAAENALGHQLLQGFLCFCREDEETLVNLRKEIDYYPLVFQGPPGIPRHNVDRPDASDRLLLMDVLAIDHPDPAACVAIFNRLVDSAGVNRVALFDTQKEAKDVVYRMPKTFKMVCADLSGWRFERRGHGGTVNQIPDRLGGNAVPRLGADTAAVRAMRQAELDSAQTLLQSQLQSQQQFESAIREAREEETAASKQMVELQKKKKAARRALQTAQDHNDALNTQLTQLTQGNDTQQRIVTLTQMSQQAQLRAQQIQIEKARKEQELAAAQEQEQQARQEKQNARDISHAETLDRLRGAITKLAEQETAAAKALEKAQGFLDSHRFHIEHTQNELEMERANREDFKQQAEQVCPAEDMKAVERKVVSYLNCLNGKGDGTEPDDSIKGILEDPQALRKKADDLEKTIDEHNRILGDEYVDIAELRGDYEALQGEVEAAQDRLEHVKDTWKRFRKSQHKRMNKLVLQKEMDAITVDKSFQKWMRRRKHLSRLIIDYENTCIDMWVKKDAARLDPEDQEKLEWTKHLKQLSGGERSYTTVCMLLAIATKCEFPFHCFDEYDVFMDLENRMIATELLLSFAAQSEYRGRQFVLLTPQNIDVVHKARTELEKRTGALPDSFISLRRMVHPDRQ